MSKLEGKIALVTGANSGIGLASAKRFVREGAYVFITGRRDRELAAAVREIGRKVIGVQGDVANLADLDRLFAQIKREKGRLDIVFANAGTARLALLGKISEEQYDAVFDVNVKGLLFTVKKALTLMRRDHSECVHLRQQRAGGVGGLQRHQSRRAFIRANLGGRIERSPHPRERGQRRLHRNAWIGRPTGCLRRS
jgi:NAD(P)-dependent dehydrogenase (short-subunit alcohol dehydrogenase family)